MNLYPSLLAMTAAMILAGCAQEGIPTSEQVSDFIVAIEEPLEDLLEIPASVPDSVVTPDPVVITPDPVVVDISCSAGNEDELRNCIEIDSSISLRGDIEITTCPAAINLVNRSNVGINGNGFTILRADSQRSCSLVNIEDSNNISIFDITFDDDARVAPCVVDDRCPRMLYMEDSDRISYDNVHVTNSKGYAFYTNQVDTLSFSNGSVRDSGVLGMYIGHSSNPSSDVLILDNEFVDNSTNGLAVLGADRVLIRGNLFENNHHIGQWPVAPQFGEGTTGGGQVYLAEGTRLWFDNNRVINGFCDTCVNNTVTAIELGIPEVRDGVDEVLITNNTILNNSGRPFGLNRAAFVESYFIDDNIMEGNGLQSNLIIGAPVGSLFDLSFLSATPIQPVVPTEALLFTGPQARPNLASVWSGAVDCDIVDGVLNCANYQLGPSAPSGVPTLAELNSSLVERPAETPVQPPEAIEIPNDISGTSVRIQIETDSHSGWERRTDGDAVLYEYVLGNSFTSPPNDSQLSYLLRVPQDGEYQVQFRARALRSTPGRVDLHNDAWIQLDGEFSRGINFNERFIKIFTSGDGQWHNAGALKIDATGQSSFPRQFLRAGVDYTLNIQGRSQGYGIDYIDIFLVGTAPEPIDNAPRTGRYEAGDFVLINHDNGPDPDDLQAIIANREILDNLTSIDFRMVAATQGHLFDAPVAGSLAHTRSLFPSALDANGDYDGSIDSAATACQLTLTTGNICWVAEGGPSDFTADMLRELQSRGVSNLKNIHVVQHSHGPSGWNEQQTRDDNLALVMEIATYITIDNGNSGAACCDETANLNADRGTPSNATAVTFRSRALNSQYSDQWEFAFDALNDNVDFSDTVELMYILGIDESGTYNVLSFANDYF